MSSARFPFWLHQLAEYLLGTLLIVQGAHLGEGGGPVSIGGGLVIVALAALSDGPLGLVRWVGRGFHRVLDVVVAALLGATPLLEHANAVTVAVAESAAVVMLMLARATRYAAAPQVPEGQASGAEAPSPARRERRTLAADAARVSGFLAGRASSRGPETLGRLAGRAVQARRRGRGGSRRSHPHA